ncbi:MAG: methyltransferase domain-containing protein [Leptolyngbya sp. SIO1D8]|nr:methyltransferase domain-containing protein [Leptolyngbya sp. SIO1D8]
MREIEQLKEPAILGQIRQASEQIGFDMASEQRTGSLLRTLVATKSSGNFLEIGTGTGLGTAWMLSGMDQRSRLTTIEQNNTFACIAQQYLGADQRVTFRIEDAGKWLEKAPNAQFDLIFADAWPGKYSHLETALGLLKIGGIYREHPTFDKIVNCRADHSGKHSAEPTWH